MLDRLLVSLGSAAIGGALMYYLWSMLSQRVAALRAGRKSGPRARGAGPAAAERPEPSLSERSAPPGGAEGLAEIRESLADLARAQVSIIERLEKPVERRSSVGHEPDGVADRLDGMAATLRALAERAGPETAIADAMEALDARLSTIEDRLDPGEAGAEDDDRDAALAEAIEALASRLEGVETGLGKVLDRADAASAAAPDPKAQAAALRSALDDALPAGALEALETRLADRLSALEARLASAEGQDPAGLTARLEGIAEQLRAASEAAGANRVALDALVEAVTTVQRQLDGPGEVALSEESIASLQAMLEAGGAEAGQGALAESLGALDARLDGVQARLDALASDRSVGRTLEMIGAISTLQTDTARLKAGIEQGFAALRDAAAGSAERMAAIDDRILALEAAVSAGGDAPADAEAIAALAQRLEALAEHDLPALLARVVRDALPAILAAQAQPASPPPADRGAPGPAPVPFTARTNGTAEIARAEAALLRARPGLATVIGRPAPQDPSGSDG